MCISLDLFLYKNNADKHIPVNQLVTMEHCQLGLKDSLLILSQQVI